MSTLTAGASRSIGLGGLLVEHAGQAAGAEQVEGEDQIGRTGPVSGLGICSGHGPQDVGPLLDHLQHVSDRGLAVRLVPLVEQVDGAAEDDLLGVGDAGLADQRAQRHQQRKPPGADLPPQRLRVRAGHPAQCRAQRPGVQRVDPVHAAADADHLAAEMPGQHAVVRLGVPEDQDPGAGGDGSGELPFDQGGFAGAGLAEDELAGVGDQARAQPRERVQAYHLAEQLVPSDRGADGRGAGAGGEREQPAGLGGGGLVFRCRGDVRGAAGAGDLPSPRRRDRCPALRVTGAGACRRPGRQAGLGVRAGRDTGMS